MTIAIQLVTNSNGKNCNPTPQQRAVYQFHESRESDEADDIYSSEWFQRTQSFLKQFESQYAYGTILDSWEMVQDVNFGAFFLAHPIAGYSLWIMLQASLELDQVVCGSSPKELDEDGFKPFMYLKSGNVRARWQTSLLRLRKEISCGELDGDALIQRLYDIIRCVEKLEEALITLNASFGENLLGFQFVDKMLERATSAVDERCKMIEEILRVDDSPKGKPTDVREPQGKRKRSRRDVDVPVSTISKRRQSGKNEF